MDFPYISQIIVNNCYTYQDFKIPSEELKEFKHIVITGKNGSGKTTILDRIHFLLNKFKDGTTKEVAIALLISSGLDSFSRKEILNYFKDLDLKYIDGRYFLKKMPTENENYIISYFKAHRRTNLVEVATVTKEENLISELKKYENNTDAFVKLFKQYLVNKKIYEAFEHMNPQKGKTNQTKIFFDNLRDTLRGIFSDAALELEFVQENFEFFLVLSDGRKITFNQLSEGFSAFLSIIMDLLMRTDLIRKQKQDYTYEPSGIVLIDEPETHLHLSMQYEILPLITKLFPKIQLIVATHSPAIMSSLKNAIVYDLTSKEEVSDWVLGSSFSELMIRHFGLENEYSPIADKIIEDVKLAVQKQDTAALKQILELNEPYLTPTLRLEIESQLIYMKNRIAK